MSSAAALERLFPGDSELAFRMRALDFSTIDLGPPQTWPAPVQAAVSLCLTSRIPIVLYLGPNYTTLYNDPYISFLGQNKHPRSLGQPARECWSEVWETIEPMLASVYATGRATWSEDLLMSFARHLPLEEVYIRFTFGPILGVDGRSVAGIFCPCTETTEQVVSARRLETLRKLGVRAAQGRAIDAACQEAAAVLGENPYDIPFAAIYLLDSVGERATLCATAGLGELHPLPPSVAMADCAELPFVALSRTLRTHRAQELALPELLGAALPGGPWPEPARQAVCLPLPGVVPSSIAGLLVVGVSPRRVFDAGYMTFFELAAGHIGTAVAESRAYLAERQRAETLAELDRAKTAFFSNVSHEFRTPLTLLLGPLEDALGSADKSLGGESLEAAYRNALRLLRLVNALLDFSRIEAGRAQVSFEPTDLAELTRGLAGLFRSAIERAGLRLLVRCEALPELVYVDREMWEKTVLNLLSNALKFTFDGEIEISLTAEQGRAILRVRDTGTGIAPHELPRLFERFHRIEGARARTHEGSGIGLALVHELVRLHGGGISVRSELGRGTEFAITLPFGTSHLPAEHIGRRRPGSEPATQAVAFIEEALRWLPSADAGPVAPNNGGAPADVTTSGYILVADDNADMREYLARLLGERWAVQTVGDGQAALAAVRERRPLLIITDVMMPHLDGFGLIRELRQDPATQSIPVIMLSARAGEEARIEGIEAGADDYLVKPFSARELLARVTTRLELQLLGSRLVQERAAIAELFAKTPMPVAVWRGPELVSDIANPAFIEVVGGRDVRGKPLLVALPELKGQGFDHLLRQVMRTGVAHVGREASLRLSRYGRLEDTYWTFICAPLRGDHGESDSVIGICNEVTQQVEARQRLEVLAAEAHAANRAKDEFLAMLGHELRNPLSPIVSALQLMRLRGAKSTEQEIIERQVRHLTRLIDDLLDVSRITRGKLELRKQRVELAEIVARALEIVTQRIEHQGHHMEVQVPRQGLVIDVDPDRMAQVISNLLVNAAKYSEPGSQIQLRAERDRDNIRLHVKDHGIGIAPEMLSTVFDMFVQQPQTLARSGGGLGLGLTIVRSLVQMHGGTVSAQSAGLGEGSEFVVELPACEHPPDERSRSSAPRKPGQPAGTADNSAARRILVVDDNLDAARMLAAALTEVGYAVTVAHDGPSALKLVEETQPEVALVDIGLPQMDGYELARRLRAQQGAAADLHLVAVTGYGQEADRRRAQDAGFEAHLVKPVDLGRLLRIVQEL